ncbi:MAG TPA: DUF4157 domain-containing protein [Bryobacteraceae bacterium]|nr:DUF4157 domain-containing protein [Bryobacteraceae bacterium]
MRTRQPQTHARAHDAKPAHAPTRPQGALPDLQRAAGNGAVAQLIGSGEPLDPDTRSLMEQRFHHDFGAVRVHTGMLAAESAQSLRAVAYTVDRDVVFDSGAYAPNTPKGRRLLSHELAHVVQQSRGGAAPDPWDRGSAIESDADRASEAVFQPGAAVHVSGASGIGIARQGDDKKPDPKPAEPPASAPRTYTIEEVLAPPTLEDIAQYTADMEKTNLAELTELMNLTVKEMVDYKGAQSMNIWQVAVVDFTKDGRRYVAKGVFDGKVHAEENALKNLAAKVPRALWAGGRIRMVVSKENCSGCQSHLQAEARKSGVIIETFVPVLPGKPLAPGKPQEFAEKDIGKGAVDRAARAKKLSKITLITDRTFKPDPAAGKKPQGGSAPSGAASGSPQQPGGSSAKSPAKSPMARVRRPSAIKAVNPAVNAPPAAAPAGAPKEEAKQPAETPLASPKQGLKPETGVHEPEKPAGGEAHEEGETPKGKPEAPEAEGGKPADPVPPRKQARKPAAPPAARPKAPARQSPQPSGAEPKAEPKAPGEEPRGGVAVENQPPSAGQTKGRFSAQVPGIDPFRHADAVGQGSIWLLEGLHKLLNYFVEKRQKEALQKRWNEELPKMQEFLEKGQGVVVWVEYTQHKVLPDSAITPTPEFVDFHWQPGTRHQKAPDTVRGAGQTAVLEPTYIAPPKEAARQLNEEAVKTRLSDLWYKQKTLQSSGQRMSKEWALGRWIKKRAQDHIDLKPVYDARSELMSAGIAVRQGRLADAAASLDAAEKFLDQMWKNIVAYRGKDTFDD